MLAMTSLPDVLVQWLRDLRRRHRFHRELAHRLSRIDQDRHHADTALRQVLNALLERPPMASRRKGAPDAVAVLKSKAREALALMDSPQTETRDAALLSVTRWMASTDARDAETFHAYGLAFCLVHQQLLDDLRGRLTPHVVMHMTCRPRIGRAVQSSVSFASLETRGISQLNVVGGDPTSSLFRWDASLDALCVPVADSYDHLAGKVAAAYFVLAMVPEVKAVLKVDDDHRAGDTHSLARLMSQATRCRAPTQWGTTTTALIRLDTTGSGTSGSVATLPSTTRPTPTWAHSPGARASTAMCSTAPHCSALCGPMSTSMAWFAQRCTKTPSCPTPCSGWVGERALPPCAACSRRWTPTDPDDPMKAQLAKGVLWLSAAKAVVTVLALCSTFILARLLTPEDFGLVALALTMLEVLAAVTELSLASSLVHHAKPTEEHFHTAWTMNLIRGGLIGAGLSPTAHREAETAKAHRG